MSVALLAGILDSFKVLIDVETCHLTPRDGLGTLIGTLDSDGVVRVVSVGVDEGNQLFVESQFLRIKAIWEAFSLEQNIVFLAPLAILSFIL